MARPYWFCVACSDHTNLMGRPRPYGGVLFKGEKYPKALLRHPGPGVRIDFVVAAEDSSCRLPRLRPRREAQENPSPPDFPSIASHPTNGRAGPRSNSFGYFCQNKSTPPQGHETPSNQIRRQRRLHPFPILPFTSDF